MNNFTKLLLSIQKQEHFDGFLVNAMTGKIPKSLINTAYTADKFKRKNHGFAHFVVTFYKNVNGFKEYERPRYYYVIQQKKSEIGLVKIRADLNEHWIESYNVYVAIVNDNFGWSILANQFYPSKNITYKDAVLNNHYMNTDLNLVWEYDVNKHIPIYFDKVENNASLDKYITESFDYIEPVAYTKYRARKNSRKIKAYNTTTNKMTDFKSLKQCFDLLHLEKVMNYKKFQRLTKSNKVTVSVNNTTYVLYTESSETNPTCDIITTPQGTGMEGHEVSHNCCNNISVISTNTSEGITINCQRQYT